MSPRSQITDGARADGSGSTEPGPRQPRQRVIEAAADLLAREGRDAVTTRAVAVAAGLQPPAIYRLFGDKDGLLEAVAEHGFATFLAAKHVDPDRGTPSRTCGTAGIWRSSSVWTTPPCTR